MQNIARSQMAALNASQLVLRCQDIFKALALFFDAFYKSIYPSVCPSVCVSVCSLLRYRINVFLPPLTEVKCPIF